MGKTSLLAGDIGKRVEAKASLDTLLLRLRDMPLVQWRMPLTKRLGEGECKGLVELRYEVGNVEYRALGHFAENWHFVLLMIAREINNAWVPKDACTTAKNRKRDMEGRRDRVRPYVFG